MNVNPSIRLRTSQFSESSLAYYEQLIDKIQDLAKEVALARSKKDSVTVIRKDVNRAVTAIAKALGEPRDPMPPSGGGV